MPDVTKRVDTRGDSVPPRPCARREVDSDFAWVLGRFVTYIAAMQKTQRLSSVPLKSTISVGLGELDRRA
jgi:hypothetical protein